MEDYLTIEEAAKASRMSRSSFYDHMRATLPVVVIGRRRVVRRRDLERWLEQHIEIGGVQGAANK